MYLVNEYLLRAYSVLGTVLGALDTSGKNTKDDCPCDTSVLAGRWTVSNKGVSCVV